MSAGHGEASGRYEARRDTAFDHAFILMQFTFGAIHSPNGERLGQPDSGGKLPQNGRLAVPPIFTGLLRP
jgi:hypothetical protein